MALFHFQSQQLCVGIFVHQISLPPFLSVFFCCFLKNLFIFRERRKKGERKGEKHQCERNMYWLLLVCTLTGRGMGVGREELNLQPTPTGNQTATFHFAGKHPTNWATPVRPRLLFFNYSCDYIGHTWTMQEQDNLFKVIWLVTLITTKVPFPSQQYLGLVPNWITRGWESLG